MSNVIFCPRGVVDEVRPYSSKGNRLSDYSVFAHFRGPVTCGTSDIEENTVFEGHWHDEDETTFNDGPGSVYYSFKKKEGIFRLAKNSCVYVRRKVIHTTCSSDVDRCSLDWTLNGDVMFHEDPDSSVAIPPDGPDDSDVEEPHGELFPGVVFCKAGEETDIEIPGVEATVKNYFDVSGEASAGRMILRPGTNGSVVGPVKLPHGSVFRVRPDSESPAYVAIGEELLLLKASGHLYVGEGVPFAFSCGPDAALSMRWAFPVSIDALNWNVVEPNALQRDLMEGRIVKAKSLEGRKILNFAT